MIHEKNNHFQKGITYILTRYISMPETDAAKASFEAFYKKHGLLFLHLVQRITGGNMEMATDTLHDAFSVIIREWGKILFTFL